MKIIQDIKEWHAIRKNLSPNTTLGFVPTMGCLHQGHASLLKKSTEQNTITLLSIFVNPTQFNDLNDYQNYPKTLDSDFAIAKKYNVDYVLLPSENCMYPDGNQITLSTSHPFANILEGAHRPGHFNGVLTIVNKLLMLVRPSKIYFGEKDYQQYFLIQQLIKNYFIDTEIVLCSTIRENSGLPFSSRNTRLSEDEFKLANKIATIYQSNEGVGTIKDKITDLGVHIDYLEIHENRLFIAVKIGKIRLIDNFKLSGDSQQ